jgi:hypothetical protein
MNIAISGLEIAEFGMEKSDPLLLFHEGLGSLNMWKVAGRLWRLTARPKYL